MKMPVLWSAGLLTILCGQAAFTKTQFGGVKESYDSAREALNFGDLPGLNSGNPLKCIYITKNSPEERVDVPKSLGRYVVSSDPSDPLSPQRTDEFLAGPMMGTIIAEVRSSDLFSHTKTTSENGGTTLYTRHRSRWAKLSWYENVVYSYDLRVRKSAKGFLVFKIDYSGSYSMYNDEPTVMSWENHSFSWLAYGYCWK